MVIGAGAVVAAGHEHGSAIRASVVQSTGTTHERTGASPSASCSDDEDFDEQEGVDNDSDPSEAQEDANECEGDNHQSETSAEQKGVDEQEGSNKQSEGSNKQSEKSDHQVDARETGSSGQHS